jgi:alanine dehydrogenase
MADLRILSAEEVRQALPMAEAVAGMKEAYAQLSAGQATVPLRSHMSVPEYSGISLVMPAFLRKSGDLGVKVVSVYPDNVKKGEPAIYAAVLMLDISNGRPVALLEGGALTAIRTGAASGAATDILARPDARIVTIFGSGVQAKTQLEAVCTVRSIESVRVYGIDPVQVGNFIQEMAGRGPIPDRLEPASTPAEAVAGTDIICAATTSSRPVFDGRDLQPGTHVNAIGSFLPEVQEIDSETVRRSLVVVDSREAALEEAGDLIIPLEAGVIDRDHIHAELGEIVAGQKPGRTNAEQITFFKSVGVAVQDAMAGRIALQNAVDQGLGTIVSL